MAAADAIIYRDGPVSIPLEYDVPASADLVALNVTATLDGTNAAGNFVPALVILTPDGKELGPYPLQETIAAGASARVSWFPGVAIVPPVEQDETVGVTTETVFYDSVNAGTPLAMSTTLVAGTEYIVVVEGTFSLWNSALAEGTPEAEAQFPGSHAGRVSTQVGLDADTCFARQAGSTRPLGHSDLLTLSTDNGVTYSHVEPVGGPYVTPITGHLYRFLVTGEGHPLHVKLNDINPPDNYGKFKITLQVPSGTGSGSGAGQLVPPSDATLNGDVLTVVAGVPAWSPSGAGITQITSVSGRVTVTNPVGPTTDLDLPASGVAAATYGDASHVAQVTVDSRGRVTGASNVAIPGVGSVAGWVSGLPGVIAAVPVQLFNASVTFGSAPLMLGCRIVIPASGTLHDIALYVVTAVGNVDVGLFDTASGTRTRLYHSGAVAMPAAGAWRIVADPNLAVSAGDQYDLVICIGSTTAGVIRFVPQAGAQMQLPSGFDVVTGGGTPLLAWQVAATSTIPSTISEASLVATNNLVGLIARIG